MKKLLLSLLLSLSLSHADVSGVKQGYGSAQQTNPMGSKQNYQEYRKSMAPVRQQAPALPPRPNAAQNKPQGILFGEIKTKFGNVRKLLSATGQLIAKGKLEQKYDPNIGMVSEELTKLEHAVGSGRSLQSIHDQEVLENNTFGKNKFDQEKYNTLLGVTKQTAMSACADMNHTVQNPNFANTCGSLKGEQDVGKFIELVSRLTELYTNNSAPSNMQATSADVTNVKMMLQGDVNLSKSKLIGASKKSIIAQLKSVVNKLKAYEKTMKKKQPGNPSQLNTLADEARQLVRSECKAILENSQIYMRKMAKGKKAEIIQERTTNAMNSFNQTCQSLGRSRTELDFIRGMSQLQIQAKAIESALKGK